MPSASQQCGISPAMSELFTQLATLSSEQTSLLRRCWRVDTDEARHAILNTLVERCHGMLRKPDAAALACSSAACAR